VIRHSPEWPPTTPRKGLAWDGIRVEGREGQTVLPGAAAHAAPRSRRSSRTPPATAPTRGPLPRCPDPVQKHTRGLVVRVLRHQLATERLSEDGLVEVVDQLAGAGGLGREAINPTDSGLYTPDDFNLFIEMRQWHYKGVERGLVHVGLTCSTCQRIDIGCPEKEVGRCQARHYGPGYVYIAGSLVGRVLKIGTTVNIGARLENKLRGQRYGGLDDWELLYYVSVNEGGKVEHAARAQLQRYKKMRMYRKDGSPQKAREIVKCRFSLAEAAIHNQISDGDSSRAWRSRNWQLYEF
jgi:hypothetical protein